MGRILEMLTAKELREKIEKVAEDLSNMEKDGNIQGINALSMYKEYLEDELRVAEELERTKSTT
jgi:hypothetical protein